MVEPKYARVLSEIHVFPAVEAEWQAIPLEDQAELLDSGLVIRGENWCEGGWLYTVDDEAAKQARELDLELELTRPRFWRQWRAARERNRLVVRPMRQFADVLAHFVEERRDEVDQRRAQRELAAAHAQLVEKVRDRLRLSLGALAAELQLPRAELLKTSRGEKALDASLVEALRAMLEEPSDEAPKPDKPKGGAPQRLSDDDIADIRSRAAMGESHASLAAEYAATTAYIRSIVRHEVRA